VPGSVHWVQVPAGETETGGGDWVEGFENGELKFGRESCEAWVVGGICKD
jgi:hypothetical protein